MEPPSPLTDADLQLLARLAALARPPASAGARRAGELVAQRLSDLGLAPRLEAERVHGTYWWPLGLATATAALAAFGPGRRPLRAAVATLAALAAADDLDGRRVLRRALPHARACNVHAEVGPAGSSRTIVLHAHHDAARTGLVFHPTLAKAAARHAGRLIDRAGSTPAPLWGSVAGPALVAAGALAGRPGARTLGGALSLGYVAAMADIGSSPPVPGANDNLSGVAALLAVARSLARRPPARTRVILLSTGAEEAFLAGMERFVARHRTRLAPESTAFLCLESVGSPRLLLLDGEGLLRLHRHPAEPAATIARLAAKHGIRLHPRAACASRPTARFRCAPAIPRRRSSRSTGTAPPPTTTGPATARRTWRSRPPPPSRSPCAAASTAPACRPPSLRRPLARAPTGARPWPPSPG